MKPAIYKTRDGAATYAAELAALFPKRQFVPVPAGFEGWNVAVQNDGATLALAGKRKRPARATAEA